MTTVLPFPAPVQPPPTLATGPRDVALVGSCTSRGLCIVNVWDRSGALALQAMVPAVRVTTDFLDAQLAIVRAWTAEDIVEPDPRPLPRVTPAAVSV